MSANSNNRGRAYEYAWMIVLKETLSSTRPVKVIYNSSYDANEKAWNNMSQDIKDNYIISAKAAIDTIVELEPLLDEDDGVGLILEFQKDNKGENGDVRDIVIRREDIDWEIGLSIKHNHNAVKHSRLSHVLDFGKEWYVMPCSDGYWEKVNPVFENLIQCKERKMLWKNVPNKLDCVYVPVLTAFIHEIRRAYETDPSMVQRMSKYLFGIKDYHKVIGKDKKRVTFVKTFNLYGTLNKPSKKRISVITVPIAKFPKRILSFDFKPKSKTTLEMYLDNGWALSFRIHSGDKFVSPTGLKFDVQFISTPVSVMNFECKWH